MNGDQGTMDHSTPESMFVALKALQKLRQVNYIQLQPAYWI